LTEDEENGKGFIGNVKNKFSSKKKESDGKEDILEEIEEASGDINDTEEDISEQGDDGDTTVEENTEEEPNQEEETRKEKKEPRTLGEVAREDQGIDEYKEVEDKEDGNETISQMDLMRKVDQLEAKLESFSEFQKQVGERFSSFSERVGEIRSMVLETEKNLDDVKSGYVKIKDIYHEMEPEKINRKLENMKIQGEKLDGKIEKNEELLSNLRDKVSRLKKKIDKVGDIENLADMYESIGEKISEVEEKRRATVQLSSKVESMFGEMSKALPTLRSIEDKVDVQEDLIEEHMKDIDKIKIKLDNKVILEEDLDDKLDGVVLKEEFEDKVSDIVDKIEDFVDAKKQFEELEKRIDNIENQKEERSDVKTVLENYNFLERYRSLDKRLKNIERNVQMDSLGNAVDDVDQVPDEVPFEEEPPAEFVDEEAYESADIPPKIETWIKENLERGFEPSELKKSLEVSGNEPSLVDRYMNLHGQ